MANKKDNLNDRIFVSYRRDDQAGWTSKLSEELGERFGSDAVFKDNEVISVGDDFASLINEFLSNTTAFVVVIGKNWHGKRSWRFRTRIWKESDWIRKELEFAGRNIPRIFPVLVNGAPLPSANELPPSLAFLPSIQAFELRSDRWNDDLQAFLQGMETTLREPQETLQAIVFRRDETVKNQRKKRAARLTRRFLYISTIIVSAVFGVISLISYLSEISLLTKQELNRLDEMTVGGYPKTVDAGRVKVLVNRGYAVGYSTQRNNPLWAVFRVMGVSGGDPIRFERPELFREDRRLSAPVGGASFGHGWDRGHLVANSTLGEQIGPEGQLEAFLMTNISPQSPNLNRSVWMRAEHFIREAARDRGHLFVITGPIFGSKPELVQNHPERRIQIPDAFFIIVVDRERAFTDSPIFNVIAYRFPQGVNRNDDFRDREKFGVSIDQIEAATGLDFFPEFTNKYSFWEDVEKTIERDHWDAQLDQ